MTRNRTLRWILLLIASTLTMTVGMLQAGAQSSTPVDATPEAPAVVREVLSSGNPDAAPGEVLELVQYTIPGNITLPVHIHPGMQVSTIVAGELRYTVVEGEAYLTRAGSDTQEVITPESGETAINPGDKLVEPQGLVHFARNGQAEPIVILTASLFEEDQPPSTLVEATPAA